MNTNCFRKQIQNTKQWSLPFLSWSQHPLTCTQRFEEDTKQIIRISWISQYTEVKSEKILKKSKDLQDFKDFTDIYSNIHKTWITQCTYRLLITKWHTYIQRCKLTSYIQNEPNKYRPPLSSKTKEIHNLHYLVHNI